MNKEQNHAETNAERDKLFKTINEIISTSGFLATVIKAIGKNVSGQIKTGKGIVKKRLLHIFFALAGLGFLFIGLVQIVTSYFEIELYTNLIVGVSLLFMALVAKAFD